MAITNATVLDGVLTITKADNAPLELKYAGALPEGQTETTLDDLKEGKYYSDVETIDASKLAAKANLTLDFATAASDGTYSKVTEVTGGKGADTYIISTAQSNEIAINDLSSTDVIKISNYDSSDSSATAPSFTDYEFGFAKTVALTLGSTTLNLVGASGNRVNISDSKGVALFAQSFQNVDDDVYTVTNTNTGSFLTSGNATIDASSSKRTTALTINATASNANILGGSGADTVNAAATAVIAGGKGNDTFVVTKGNSLTLTDYTLGGNEVIAYDNTTLTFQGKYEVDTETGTVVLYFTDASNSDLISAASVTIQNALWDQIKAEKNFYVKVLGIDANGAVVANTTVTQGYQDPSELKVTKIDKNTVVDLANISKGTDSIGTFLVGSDVNKVTFTASTPVKIVGGGTYKKITAGGGADTLYGADTSTSADSESSSSGGIKEITNNLTAGSFTTTGDVYISSEKKAYDVQYKAKIDGEYQYFWVRLTYTSDSTKNQAKVTGVYADGDSAHVIPLTSSTTVAGVTFNFTTLETLSTKTFDVSSNSVDVGDITTYLWNNDGAGITIKYTYNTSMIYDGGAGNDYLYGNNGGGTFIGGAGNDTFRGGTGNTSVEGGVGNDVFLLTGEGKTYVTSETDGTATDTELTTHRIADYYSGSEVSTNTNAKADAAANKKLYGTDKIQVAYDNYKTKNLTAGQNFKSSIVGGAVSGNDLEIQVSGVAWQASVAATESTPAQFADFGTDTTTANYVFENVNGKIISVIDQGITYKQVVSNATNVSLNSTDYSNYLGLLNDNAAKIDATAMTKAQRLVAGNGTTEIIGGSAVDTIIGNGKTAMTGGKGNDIFIVKSGDTVVDYSNDAKAYGKDIIRVDDFSALTGDSSSNAITANDVKLGDITLKGVVGKEVTFNQVVEEKTVGTGKTAGTYTGTKSTTTVMTRQFTTSDTLTASKTGTYLETYDVVDDSVKYLDASKAGAIKIVNGAKNIEEIVGGAKADTIEIGNNAAGTTMTVTSGKGNDVIVWNGTQNVVVTDFTKSVQNATKKTITSGDVILLNGVEKSAITTSYDGDDVILSVINGEGEDTVKNTLTLKNAKNMDAYIGDYDSFSGTVTGLDTFNNSNEYLIAKGSNFDSDSIKGTEDVPITIVNGTAATSKTAIDVSGENKVETVYGGKGVDSVYAGATTNYIDLGAGNDIVKTGGANELQITTGLGNDVIVIDKVTNNAKIEITDYTVGADKFYFADGISVKSAQFGTGYETTTTKGTTSTTTIYSDVTLTLTNADGDTENVIIRNVLQSTTVNTGKKITETPAGAITITKGNDENPLKPTTTYALDYASEEVTVGSGKDGTFFDLTGANAEDITVGKVGKNVTIESAQRGATVSVEATGKNPVYFVGNYVENGVETGEIYNTNSKTGALIAAGTSTIGGAYFKGDDVHVDATGNSFEPEGEAGMEAVIFNGSAGADVYYGNGAWDTVNLGVGNDTFKAGDNGVVRAEIISGVSDTKTKSANTFVVGAGDEYHISNFSVGNDKIVIDEYTSASYSTIVANPDDSTKKDLVLYFNTGDGDDANASVTIREYDGEKILISQGTYNEKTKKTVYANYSNLSYGDSKLELTKDDTAVVVASDDINGKAITAIDASARTAASTIYGSASTASIIGGSKADYISFYDEYEVDDEGEATGSAIWDATVTGGAGNDTYAIKANSYEITDEEDEEAEPTTVKKTLTVTDYAAGDVVSVTGAFGTAITNYNGKYTFDGTSLILEDEGAKVILQGAVTTSATKASASVKINVNSATKNVVLSDPTNVVLTKAETDLSNTAIGKQAVSVNATASNGEVKLKIDAANNAFSSFTAGAKGTDLDLSEMTSEESAVAITAGAGVDKVTLGAGKETFTFKGANANDKDVITNFGSGDSIKLATGLSVGSITVENEEAVIEAYNSEDGIIEDVTLTINVVNAKKAAVGSITVTGEVGTDAISFNKSTASDGSGHYVVSIGDFVDTFGDFEATATDPVDEPSDGGDGEGTDEDAFAREGAFAERWFMEGDDNFTTGLDEITSTSADAAAIAVDLTTDFSKSGNVFNVASALTSNKKAAK